MDRHRGKSEVKALRAMMLDDSRSQHLNEFKFSVDDKIGVKRGIRSGEVSGAIASRVMESPERKFTQKHLVDEHSVATEQSSLPEVFSRSARVQPRSGSVQPESGPV